MATIPPTVPPAGGATNAQLAGITATVPMPKSSGVLTDGVTASYNPFTNLATVGGQAGPAYSVGDAPATSTGVLANPNMSAVMGSSLGGGGAATPAFGAQPAAPGVPAVGGTAPTTPNVTANAPANGPATTPVVAASPFTAEETAAAARSKAAAAKMPTKAVATGFGRIDKNAVQKVSVGGAEFSFPSFNASAKSNDAPQATWGPGWKRVDTGSGFYYMQHANGTKAVPATEYRLSATPLEQVQTIKVANGWGKKFPDGTVVVFDKDKGAYRIAPDGTKSQLPFGKQEIGGVKVRIFEAAVVRTLEPNGAVRVFDSRGTTSLGTTRGHSTGAAAAAGGAAQVGTVTQGGGAAAAGAATGSPQASLIAAIQEMTELARGMVGQIQAGTVDPTALAAMQARMSALPAGLQQAISAGGAMPAATTATGLREMVPATAAGGGATGAAAAGAAPIAGVNANETARQLAAGTKVKLAMTVPQDLAGMKARFGQLSPEVQSAVATAFGSSQGSKAFEADAQIAFSATGEATVVEAARVFTAKQVQVRGAGPGEDLVMTMRPVRQPSSPGKMAGSGGVDAAGGATSKPKVAGGAGSVLALGADRGGVGAGAIGVSGNAAAPIGGGAAPASSMTRIKLFPAGGSVKSPALAGIEGSFTWKTLPASARSAIQSWLAANPTSQAGAALASRTGAGWNFDPDAAIVIGGNEATFLNGLGIAKPTTASATGGGATAPAPAPSGGAPAPGSGPTTTPVGHDATKPPVSGGGATGATPPAAAPPAPTVGTGTMAGMDMSGMTRH